MSTYKSDTRLCFLCGKVKPLGEFVPSGTRRIVHRRCRDCFQPAKMPAGVVMIYALVDPTDESVRYIGATVSPRLRYGDHRRFSADTRQTDDPQTRQEWVAFLWREGLHPIMRSIDEVPIDQALAREKHWIAHFRATTTKPFYNVLDGAGGLGPTSECVHGVDRRLREMTISRPGQHGSCRIKGAGRYRKGGLAEITVGYGNTRQSWTIDAGELVAFLNTLRVDS